MRVTLFLLASVAVACGEDVSGRRTDPARSAFLSSVDTLLLDTERHEMRGVLMAKVPDPDDAESPIRDSIVPHPPAPGVHTLDGRLYAEIGVLRQLLGDDLPVQVDTAMHRVYVGRDPEVLLMGHPHGDAWYVDVKLFARQYGAYVDVACTMATCAIVWPRPIMEEMRRVNLIGTGMLEAQAEGLISGISVRKLPTG